MFKCSSCKKEWEDDVKVIPYYTIAVDYPVLCEFCHDRMMEWGRKG